MKRKLRVMALMHGDLVPPDSIEGLTDKEIAPWKTEFDVVSTLQELGHEVLPLGVRGDLGVIRRALGDWRPDIVFNLLEEFDGVATLDQNVVSYLELLRVPYTGCSPRGLMLARDKALSKEILAYHRVRVPEFAVFPRGRKVRRPVRLKFPLFVKSLVEEASLGIAKASIVDDDQHLKERVQFIHQRVGTDALAETYIKGRELYAGVLGNLRLQVLPIWELLFTRMPKDAPRIATRKVKWDYDYQKKMGIASQEAVLPEGLRDRIIHASKRIYRILGITGYARIDYRLDAHGVFYVLEVNPNPQLAYGEDFAESADKAGLDYADLLQRILNLGLRRAAGGATRF
ncbi:MAG: D-alanine--D-alanine ligase [Acidobacteriota bacterium]